MESDVQYFRRRALEERLAARKAAHPVARQSHLEMAAGFEELATAIVAREHRTDLHLVSEDADST
jgi:hypothetical protein